MSQAGSGLVHSPHTERNWFVSYGAMYVIALLTAFLGKIGLEQLGNAGYITYSYASVTHPKLYDQSILDALAGAVTGEALLGFILAGGLCLALAVASAMLFVHLSSGCAYSRHDMVAAFITGVATCIVSMLCLAIVIPSCFSALQLSSMSSDASMGGLIFTLIMCVGTLIAAASLVLGWAVDGVADRPAKMFLKTVLAALICGIVVLLIVEKVGELLAEVTLDGGALVGALWIGVAVNVVIAIVTIFLGTKQGSDMKEA